MNTLGKKLITQIWGMPESPAGRVFASSRPRLQTAIICCLCKIIDYASALLDVIPLKLGTSGPKPDLHNFISTNCGAVLKLS